ncbi:hypothetical protein, partial [Coleofasciculus sp. FACHB-712]|uniref:hypothetical protein n=1 Tax=Coleofasciculus sp. FACHB-712 TaxID=2692789 RepID=UPI001A7ECEFF
SINAIAILEQMNLIAPISNRAVLHWIKQTIWAAHKFFTQRYKTKRNPPNSQSFYIVGNFGGLYWGKDKTQKRKMFSFGLSVLT